MAFGGNMALSDSTGTGTNMALSCYRGQLAAWSPRCCSPCWEMVHIFLNDKIMKANRLASDLLGLKYLSEVETDNGNKAKSLSKFVW